MPFPNRFTRSPLFSRKPSPKIVRKLDFEKISEETSILTPDTTFDLDDSWEEELNFLDNDISSSHNTSIDMVKLEMEMETPPPTTDNEEKISDIIRISDIKSAADTEVVWMHKSPFITDIYHPETPYTENDENNNSNNSAECTIMPNGKQLF